MIELPEITKAWMAGFFEGEGSIIIERRNPPLKGFVSPRYMLRVSVANTVYVSLEPFQMYFGGQIVESRTAGTNRPLYMWEVRSRLAMRFLETMLPCLRIKQKQAELAIFFQKKFRRHRGGKAPIAQVYLVERERIRQAIKELNMGWPTPTTIDISPQAKQLPLGVGDSEQSIYEALSLPYRAPEERG